MTNKAKFSELQNHALILRYISIFPKNRPKQVFFGCLLEIRAANKHIKVGKWEFGWEVWRVIWKDAQNDCHFGSLNTWKSTSGCWYKTTK